MDYSQQKMDLSGIRIKGNVILVIKSITANDIQLWDVNNIFLLSLSAEGGEDSEDHGGGCDKDSGLWRGAE
ncbi:hypothetical protein STSP1_00860 [Sedimentisphaera salicampi]|uniref:Uncharacterized protein n=1 Tax=Sedimentisphaera salicampi TaxID=1941349 RepID=A0A1W6LL08_9BACT|nr:hypothetical protein STSP1_00860 [Sedimentisphaera salicampi]OXU15364.1 hypothetical protein SMSP1_00844 [Sedimentisphaera salicampi]